MYLTFLTTLRREIQPVKELAILPNTSLAEVTMAVKTVTLWTTSPHQLLTFSHVIRDFSLKLASVPSISSYRHMPLAWGCQVPLLKTAGNFTLIQTAHNLNITKQPCEVGAQPVLRVCPAPLAHFKKHKASIKTEVLLPSIFAHLAPLVLFKTTMHGPVASNVQPTDHKRRLPEILYYAHTLMR